MAGRSDAPGEMFDVVVIGAGPAGASAARAAARAGVTVCMLERAELPRYKTCGGGLVGLAVDHAGIDLSGLVHASIDQLTVSLDGRLARTRRRPGRPMLSMVMRSEFDRALVHSACAAGAGLRTGVHVTGLREVTGPTAGPTAGPVPGPGGPDSNEVQEATAATAVREAREAREARGVRESRGSRGSTEIRQTR
ncbi:MULTISPECIES: FAD-dependent oxidoreductase, partial [unclassified Frankia]|uniref:FAD-dependent oxidoreductase n=1 Tax=unclassified Frankia TaxID=2632575 RepID=UPI002AD4A687